MAKTKLSPQIFAAVSASSILVGNGFHNGWSSPSLAKLLAEDSDILVTSSQGSWIVSFLQIGSVCGSILAISLVDKLGRKITLLSMAIPYFIACLLIAFANSYWWFYLARFITGLGTGIVLTIIPMYIGEIAEDRVRGGFGVLMTVMMNVGQIIPFMIGPYVSRATLAAVGAVIPIMYFGTFVWAPESPYYYALKSIPCKLKKSLTWLRGRPDVHEELLTIQNNVKLRNNHKGTIRDLFMVKGNLKALGILIGVVNCQQFSGYPAILAYSTIIFDGVDSPISSSHSVILLGVVKFVVTIVVAFIADKVGKRPLLLTSTLLCSIFMFGEALYFHLRANGIDVTSIEWIPLVGVIAFVISYSIGIGPIPMATSAEIFPCEIKAFAVTLGSIYMSVAGVCVTKFYQVISDAYGIHVSFYVFGACSILCWFFIFFNVPETKGRSLSEIQDLLHGSSKSKSKL